MKTNLTQKGKKLLLSALTGKELRFSKIVLGNGISDGEILGNPIMEAEINSIDISQEYAIITSMFTNSTLENSFRATEAGIFALDGEDEVLYATVQTSESSADYIPGKSERLLECRYDFVVFIGEVQNVSAAINGSIVYVTAENFNKHLNDNSNPHKVNANDVGLGNVPNVATDDQTPSVDDCKVLSDIKSGEKLKIIFGKISLAIRCLILHLSDFKNPHKVSAEDIGAAQEKHTHAISDLNKGILPIERGGTGCNSMDEFMKIMDVGNVVVGTFCIEGNFTNVNDPPIPLDLGFYPRAAIIVNCNPCYREHQLLGMALRNFPCHHSSRSVSEVQEWHPYTGLFKISETGLLLGQYALNSTWYYIAFK